MPRARVGTGCSWSEPTAVDAEGDVSHIVPSAGKRIVAEAGQRWCGIFSATTVRDSSGPPPAYDAADVLSAIFHSPANGSPRSYASWSMPAKFDTHTIVSL